MKIQAVGFPWFRREDFDRLRSMFEDGDKLHRTYDEWLAAAEKGCDHLRAQGVTVVRAIVNPDEFPAWCAAKGLKLNANARTMFAAECAAAMTRKPE